MSSELTELLRKCHRDELLPLAEAIGIKPEGMTVRQLATAIDVRLRHRAANDLENLIFRGGNGPPYVDMLRRVGRRLGLDVGYDAALAEQAIAREHTRQTWHLLPDREREARWEQSFSDTPAPEFGDQALALLEKKYHRGLGWHLTQLATNPPIPMPAGCLIVPWLMRPRYDIVEPAILEIARLRQTVRYRVTIGIVGSPSTGKDAAINALFGINTGNVSPVAGSTKHVEIRRLEGPTALYLVNTPGMGDVMESVRAEAKEILDHIDIYLYLVNAQGGVQARELADYQECVATGRPVLAVVNKIDTLRQEDRERYLADARTKLRAPDDSFVSAAFDPLPQLAPGPLGLANVRGWITDQLVQLGKDPAELPWVDAA
ncbi:MAG: GTPase [Myxococcota bacterium]